MQTFFSDSLFLCDNQAIKLFAQCFLNHILSSEDKQKKFTVICERKEDIVSIQTQIFYEINKKFAEIDIQKEGLDKDLISEMSLLSGIKTFYLDSFTQFLYTFFAAHSCKQKQSIIDEKPFIYLDEQEKLVELILRILGYHSSDCSSLAKQILILIDAPWPQEENFFTLLASLHKDQKKKSIHEISEKTFKQFLATFQIAKEILSRYVRLQTFTNDFLNENFLFSFLQESSEDTKLFLPKDLTESCLLWISAPEYGRFPFQEGKNFTSVQTFKPGNIQSYVIDEFFSKTIKIREHLCDRHEIFIHSRTVLKLSENDEKKGDNKFFSIDVSKDLINFYYKTLNFVTNKNPKQENLALLGDFHPGQFKRVRSDAGGDYFINEKDIDDFFVISHNNSTYDKENLGTSNNAFRFIYEEIEKKFEEFLNIFSLIEDTHALSSISQSYNLSCEPLQDEKIKQIFKQMIVNEKINIGHEHPIEKCAKIFSFLPCKSIPENILVIGKPHPFLAPSFHVKILNQMIFEFHKQTGILEVPSHERIYRGYWNWLTNLPIPITFYLASPDETLNFPPYLNIPKENFLWIKQAHLNLPSLSFSSLETRIKNGFVISDWQNKFKNKPNFYSVTEFEHYVNCPLAFFLKKVLHIKNDTTDIHQVNNEQVGSKTHKILEVFLRRVSLVFGNKFSQDDPNRQEGSQPIMVFYERVMKKLDDESFLTTLEKDDWNKGFISLFEELRLNPLFQNFSDSEWLNLVELAHEIGDIIWKDEDNKISTHLEREIIKRSFKRFIIEETNLMQNYYGSKTILGNSIEEPVSFYFKETKFVGTIDRLDVDKEGFHIIDYKTSKISKYNSRIVLFPSEKKQHKDSQLSVQGALYAYSLAKKLHNKIKYDEDSEYQNDDNDVVVPLKLKAFSLYKLRSLDTSLSSLQSYLFDGFQTLSEFIERIEAEYTPYLEQMNQGVFHPNPILSPEESPQHSPCGQCELKVVCPHHCIPATDESV
ncbi:MAG: PD-(D/E)XK nuclease family protein [Silvanigrellaceae bacterium]|nr:PD-(D/E)XK nuclease family protein [Silvanigrellaceae bacterium]